MVEIRALKRFRGRNSVLLMPGECQTVPHGFASVKIRLGQAELVKPVRKRPGPSTAKVVEPTVKKVVEPPQKKAKPRDEKGGLLKRLVAAGVETYNRRHSVATLNAAVAELEAEG